MISEQMGDRMQKHVALDEAIKSIYQVQQHANNLLNRISNIEDVIDPEVSPNKSSIPSLEQVLIDGPDRIRKACEEVSIILDQVQQRLF